MKLHRIIIRKFKYYILVICCFVMSLQFLISGKRKKLAVLYLYADRNKYPEAYNNLTKLLRSIKGFEILIIKIDNFNEQKKHTKENSYVYDIGGDNTYWEFSGWQKGLNFLKELKIKYDYVMFVNDAFMNAEKEGRDLLYFKSRINTLTLSTLKQSVLGEIDTRNKNETILGYDVSSWIRTNLFVIPFHIATDLKFPLICPEVLKEIFPDKYTGKLFLKNDHINSTLMESLEEYITNRWRYCETPNPQNYSFLRSKLICVLNEMLFTAKLREKKVPIVSMGEMWENLKLYKIFFHRKSFI